MKFFPGDKNNPEELFAEPGAMPSRSSFETQDSTDRILSDFRAPANLPSLHELMIQSFTKLAKNGQTQLNFVPMNFSCPVHSLSVFIP